jgi:hypothetical protein
MFTNPHDACLLATYLVDMSRVVSPQGAASSSTSPESLTLVGDFAHYLRLHNHEWPPRHSIGRISILFLPRNLFNPTAATGAFLHDYLPELEYYVYITRSILTIPPHNHPPTKPPHHSTPPRH